MLYNNFKVLITHHYLDVSTEDVGFSLALLLPQPKKNVIWHLMIIHWNRVPKFQWNHAVWWQLGKCPKWTNRTVYEKSTGYCRNGAWTKLVSNIHKLESTHASNGVTHLWRFYTLIETQHVKFPLKVWSTWNCTMMNLPNKSAGSSLEFVDSTFTMMYAGNTVFWFVLFFSVPLACDVYKQGY